MECPCCKADLGIFGQRIKRVEKRQICPICSAKTQMTLDARKMILILLPIEIFVHFVLPGDSSSVIGPVAAGLVAAFSFKVVQGE